MIELSSSSLFLFSETFVVRKLFWAGREALGRVEHLEGAYFFKKTKPFRSFKTIPKHPPGIGPAHVLLEMRCDAAMGARRRCTSLALLARRAGRRARALLPQPDPDPPSASAAAGEGAAAAAAAAAAAEASDSISLSNAEKA